MRKSTQITCLILIFLFVFNTLPATAASTDQYSGEKAIRIGVVTAVVVGAVYLIRSAVVNNKAAKLYQQAESLAAAGDWERAVEAYAEVQELNPKYKDVAAKLAAAKEQAGAMFLRLGDNAWDEEKLEAAEAYYHKALQYVPASTEARQKLNQLAQELALVYYRRGLSYEKINRWPEALREYERAYLLAPQLAEVADHYQRAKTEVNKELPLKAILFFLNQTTKPGIEDFLARELQTKMEAQATDKYVMLTYDRVQAVVTEQAAALSGNLNDTLAMDLGRILGADEVIVGTIHSLEAKKRIRIVVSVKSLQVTDGRIKKEVKPFTYTFSRGTAADNWWTKMPELAAELAKRLD